MASIDIKELESCTGEMLRRVREDGETIDLTEGGVVIAQVVPVESKLDADSGTPTDREAMRAWLRSSEEVAQEVAKYWPKGVSAVDAVRDVRRDL